MQVQYYFIARCLPCLVCVGGILLTAVEPCLFAQASDNSTPAVADAFSSQENKKLVGDLIEQLADPSFHRRQNAEWQLQQLGLAAFEQLRLATNHPNIQIADRAAYINASQQVTWWLDGDSAEVRSYLRDYSTLDPDRRAHSIMMLGQHDKPDSWLALCRLARFDHVEYSSRLAALALLENIANHSNFSVDEQSSIRSAIGTSSRLGVKWLSQAMQDLEQNNADIDAWLALIDEESTHDGEASNAAQNKALRRNFYKWLWIWLERLSGKEEAMNTVGPLLLSLAGGGPDYGDGRTASFGNLREFSNWALDRKFPQLVQELAKKFSDSFESNGELTYLLAESFLQLGDEETAERLAKNASEILAPPPEALRMLADPDTARQNQRRRVASTLANRGLFQWADTEYEKALAFTEKNPGSDNDIELRLEVSQYFWLGNDSERAAAALQPLMDLKFADEDALLRSRRQALMELIGAYYHFYEGLKFTEQGNSEKAREHLQKALDADRDRNPDIVIAMQKAIDGDEQFAEIFESNFTKMRDTFRQAVVNSENALSAPGDRVQRNALENNLASSCNQLAWLLAKCGRHTEEAVRLSERSLQLKPDYPVYLDTLGRCYFSNGQIVEAVETQRQAVSEAPFERQMLAQLAEFEKALAAMPDPTKETKAP